VRSTDHDLRPYLERLGELPFVRDARPVAFESRLHGPLLDAELRVDTPSGPVTYAVEFKSTTLTRDLAERLLHLATNVPRLMVFAPAVGPEVGNLFANAGVDFVDLVGNCHVHIDDRYVARIQGRRLPPRPVAERALRAPAFRVLFALLADPDLVHATTRALAVSAGGVSPQTARDARARLAEEGVLIETRGGLRWTKGGWKRALDRFLIGFPTLAPGLTIGRYRARERSPDAIEQELEPRLAAIGEWRWGGGAAATRLDGHYRGDRTIAYFRDAEPEAVRRLPLVPDPGGNVVLMRAPGPLALDGPRPDCAHPLLVYADLLAEGHERSREGAAAIFDKYLSPIAEGA
jgi:hypothetical protein